MKIEKTFNQEDVTAVRAFTVLCIEATEVLHLLKVKLEDELRVKSDERNREKQLSGLPRARG